MKVIHRVKLYGKLRPELCESQLDSLLVNFESKLIVKIAQSIRIRALSPNPAG